MAGPLTRDGPTLADFPRQRDERDVAPGGCQLASGPATTPNARPADAMCPTGLCHESARSAYRARTRRPTPAGSASARSNGTCSAMHPLREGMHDGWGHVEHPVGWGVLDLPPPRRFRNRRATGGGAICGLGYARSSVWSPAPRGRRFRRPSGAAERSGPCSRVASYGRRWDSVASMLRDPVRRKSRAATAKIGNTATKISMSHLLLVKVRLRVTAYMPMPGGLVACAGGATVGAFAGPDPKAGNRTRKSADVPPLSDGDPCYRSRTAGMRRSVFGVVDRPPAPGAETSPEDGGFRQNQSAWQQRAASTPSASLQRKRHNHHAQDHPRHRGCSPRSPPRSLLASAANAVT